mmetsp:Transcript_46127/g.90911  ORF Transcript_46127/g.90911 Transcript_46127/m.90911 type:complete len:569 (+) Transcript_46127:1067-2773(+)
MCFYFRFLRIINRRLSVLMKAQKRHADRRPESLTFPPLPSFPAENKGSTRGGGRREDFGPGHWKDCREHPPTDPSSPSPPSLPLPLTSTLLVLDRGDLAEHNGSVGVEERNSGEALAVLERVDHQRVEGLEFALGSLSGLEGVRSLHLLSSGLLAHLPDDLRHLAGRATATDESDGGVPDLDLVGDIEGLDLGLEGLAGLEGVIGLVHHDVSDTGHVVLVETLDVESDVVTGVSLVDSLVVHLDSEDLSDAGLGGSVGGQEDDLLAGLHKSLLDTASDDITHTLDLVDTGDGHAHERAVLSLGELGVLLEGVEEGVNVDRGVVHGANVVTLPPVHLLGLLGDVVPHPAGDRDHGDGLGNEVLLPAHLLKHVSHLIRDLLVSLLLVTSNVAIHLVDSDDQLLDTEQVDQTGVLAGLTLDLSGLVVSLLDGSGEVTISGNHQKSDICLGSTGNHVLDEISVPGSVNDGVVPRVSEELLGGARDGHTTLTLLLLSVHVEGKSERRLAELLGLLLELLELTLGDTSELEEETAGGGGLAGIDVSADNNGNVGLSFSHFERSGFRGLRKKVGG